MSNAANTRISEPQGIDMVFYRIKKNFTSVDPYLTVFGIFLWLFAYWVLCEGLQIGRLVNYQVLLLSQKTGFLSNRFRESLFLLKNITII